MRNACDSGEVCVAGVCSDRSSCGLTVCDGACVDITANNPHYCGDCDVSCSTDEVCDDGCVKVDKCQLVQTMVLPGVARHDIVDSGS